MFDSDPLAILALRQRSVDGVISNMTNLGVVLKQDPGTFAHFVQSLGFPDFEPSPTYRVGFLYFIILGLALLTNWVTVQKSVKRLKELDEMATDGRYELLPKKEVIKLERERKHLQANLAGIKNMNRLPDAIFVIDSNKEQIAVREARKLGIPVVAVVDTNCDPTEGEYVIPGNDDALRAIRLFTSKISESIAEGAQFMSDKQIAEMSAANEAAQAAADAAPPIVYSSETAVDGSEDISMEEVLGAGTHKKPVAAEEPELPKVESQTV